MRKFFTCRSSLLAGTCMSIAALLAGCSSPPKQVAAVVPPPASAVLPPPAPAPVAVQQELPASTRKSAAQTPREYRLDAAGHLYSLNAKRIYHGKMPPLLYAVGVLQVEVDARGNVISTSWMRAPSQAPEVMAEIERMVRQAAPYPAPVRLGRVTYTDTWLWHKSGQFQLDTLTEGQY